jgi:SAM-dependent methyltransferase
MQAYRHCTDPGCSPANSVAVLRSEAACPAAGPGAAFCFTLQLCTRCRMGFVDPVPPQEVLAALYADAYPYYAPAGEHPDREARSLKYRLAGLRYRALCAPTAANRARALVAALGEWMAAKTVTFTLGLPLALPATSRILDYGFGSGSWLMVMRRLGYSRLTGYDIAANTHRGPDLASEGIQVVAPGALRDQPDAAFDCVRLEHVFEHLADPPSVLREIHRLLVPGGRLVMTFPSIYPWLAVADLAASPHLDHLQLPIHLAHHSLQSSTRLVRAAGFEAVVARITRGDRSITLLAHKRSGADAAHPRP